MKIDQFLEYLQYERNYSTHTVFSYRNDLSQFHEFVCREQGGFNLSDVDKDLVRAWVVELMDSKREVSTVKRKLSALKSFYRFQVQRGEIKKNPVSTVISPKTSKKIPNFVKESEMDFLLDDSGFGAGFESIRDYTILTLFYTTGLRRAELIALRDQDVDFYSAVIKVTGKRNKQRLIPIGDELMQLLQLYLEERDVRIGCGDGSLFVKADGGSLYPMLVQRIVAGRLSEVTQGKNSPHVLRHTFATTMLNNGAQLNSVKELLGHSSLASTEVYTHVTFEELKKTYKTAHPRAGQI